MSCLLTKNEPLSWKVTRDNRPYQSVKRATGGVYSVITYNDRGIVFKRQFFDRNHTWLRTEYFNRSIADKLITRIYPRKVSGIITLVTEDIDDNGIVSVKTLFPSDKQSNENSRVLIYSNVGMLWYDASFLPSDMPFTEKNPTATADLCLTVICSKMILFPKMLIISKIALILRTKIFQMFPTRLNP